MATGVAGTVLAGGALRNTTIGWSSGAIPANEITNLTSYYSSPNVTTAGLWIAAANTQTDYTGVATISGIFQAPAIHFSGEHTVTNHPTGVTGKWYSIPPNATPSVNPLSALEGNYAALGRSYLIVAWQTRLVYAATFGPYSNQLGNGVGPFQVTFDDVITYTAPTTVFSSASFTSPEAVPGLWGNPQFGLIAGDDQISRIGAIGVVAADQLLIVKARDGGVVISGSINNPTIRRMPYVESTHGVICQGAMTPLGLVYGSKTGIYAWTGGDTAVKLSPQIDGFFWNHAQNTTDDIYMANRGRMAYWNEYIVVPNNYVYNSRVNSWWRFSGATNVPYNVYDIDRQDRMFAFPYKLTTTQNTLYHIYDQAILAQTYSWQSQPLLETRGRKTSFQEVRMVVTHKGSSAATITVTLTGYTSTGAAVTPAVIIFTVPTNTASVPQLLYKDIAPNFQAEYVQVRIQADSGNANDAAPKVHSIKFGTRDSARTIRTA
jgi:hypothetical protein